jgi:hypothetical protein
MNVTGYRLQIANDQGFDEVAFHVDQNGVDQDRVDRDVRAIRSASAPHPARVTVYPRGRRLPASTSLVLTLPLTIKEGRRFAAEFA